MTDRRLVIGIVCAMTLALLVWTGILRWAFRPSPPPPPDPPVLRVEGTAVEEVRAPRVSMRLEVCGSTKELPGRVAAVVAKGKGLELALEELNASDDEACRNVALRSTALDAAFAWYTAARALPGVDQLDDPECAGDAAVATAKRATEAHAIEDAKTKLEALAAAAHQSIGALDSADVSSDEGSWDERCLRTVTSTATVSVHPL